MRKVRLLVCGGRDYKNKSRLYNILHRIYEKYDVEILIQGGAKGADRLAKQFCLEFDLPMIEEKAEWNKYGKQAGILRNQAMIDLHSPTLIVAFPGGTGTADMVARGKKAGIPVLEIN